MADTLQTTGRMADESMREDLGGELIYEYTAQFTELTDYGVSLDALLAGKAAPPAEGARFDIAFAGASAGPKLNGAVKGVDYIHMRADGRIQLHIHAEITTDDGMRIALAADGVGLLTPDSPVGQLRENVTLTTSSVDYAWVNPIQVWASGTVDLAKGEVRVRGYAT